MVSRLRCPKEPPLFGTSKLDGWGKAAARWFRSLSPKEVRILLLALEGARRWCQGLGVQKSLHSLERLSWMVGVKLGFDSSGHSSERLKPGSKNLPGLIFYHQLNFL